MVICMRSIRSIMSCIVNPRFCRIEATLRWIQITHLMVMGRNWRRWDIIAIPEWSGKVPWWHWISFWKMMIKNFNVASQRNFNKEQKMRNQKNRWCCKMFSLQDSLLNVSLYYVFLFFSFSFRLLKNCVRSEEGSLQIMPTTCYFATHYQINALVTINSSDSNEKPKKNADNLLIANKSVELKSFVIKVSTTFCSFTFSRD